MASWVRWGSRCEAMEMESGPLEGSSPSVLRWF